MGSEGIESVITTDPLTALKEEFIGISPFVIFTANNRLKATIINLLMATVISSICFLLYKLTNDLIQWVAFGLGAYILSCWIQGLKFRDPVTFNLLFKTKSLLFTVIGFPFISFVTYSIAAFGPAFYMRNFGISRGRGRNNSWTHYCISRNIGCGYWWIYRRPSKRKTHQWKTLCWVLA